MRFRPFLLATLVILPSLALAGPQDREIAEQIAGALQASGQLRAYDIRVKVEDGTAWLRGRVANERQMSAAIALAFQMKGVKQVANGLTIWTGPKPQKTLAPLASRQPVAPVVERARLAPRPSAPAQAPTPVAPAASPAFPAPPTPAGDLADDPVALPKNSVEQASALVGDWPAHPHTAAAALRNPDFVSTADAPFTAQKASYHAVIGKAPPMEHHMANVLAGVSEPILLPHESDNAAGEAFVCDENATGETLICDDSDATPALLPAARQESPALEDPASNLTLIQTLPEPTRHTWAGTFKRRGEPRMQALLED